MENWNIKYQPKTLQEIIGHQDEKIQIQGAFDNNHLTHWLLHGEPGSGKTTLARIIGEMYLEKDMDNKQSHFFFEEGEYHEYDASVDRGIEMVRGKIRNMLVPMGKAVFHMDEADSMTPEAQNGLRGTMDKALYKQKFFIFTGNDITKFHEAILSRCRIIRIGNLSEKEILRGLVNILKLEGIPLKNEKERDYVLKLAKFSRGDMRKAIDSLQRSVSFGKVDIREEFQVILDEIPNIHSLLEKVIQEGSFFGLREELILMLYEDETRIDPKALVREAEVWISDFYKDGTIEEMQNLLSLMAIRECDKILSQPSSPITQLIGMFAELRMIWLQFAMKGDDN